MTQYIKLITDFIDKNARLIDIVLGIVLLLIFVFFRKSFSKAVLNLFSRVIFRKDENKRTALKSSLQKPFAAFFAVLGIFLCVYLNFRLAFVVKAFKIAVILVICWGLVNYLSDNLFLHLHFSDNPDEKINTTAVKFISNILKILVVVFAVVMVISELGYNINGLITGIGVGGLAISLAAQDAVSNLISGFIIVLEKPFVDGDFIQTKSIQGTVVEVTMRSTKIKMLDDCIVTLPNSILTSDAIINLSKLEKRLIDIEIGLVYSTSNELLKTCQEEIKEYLNSNDKILPYPLRVEFEKLDDSSLNLNIFCYTSITDIHQFKALLSEVNYNVKAIVEKNGAEFAFPSSSIYIEKK